MLSVQIKSHISIEELIVSLSNLDAATLAYLVTSLQKIQAKKTDVRAEIFWNFIKKIDWAAENNTLRLKELINALTMASVETIYQFSEYLAFLLHQLDGPAFFQPLKETDLGVSSDTFLYARCLVVAKGEHFYKEVLAHPEKMPLEEDFEDLLYVARQAYEQKTGQNYDYIPTIIYESFFNKKLWGEKAKGSDNFIFQFGFSPLY